MKNTILNDYRAFLDLDNGKALLNPRQRLWYQELLRVAKPVRCVPAASVLDDEQLYYIRHVLRPKKKQCFRNAHLLCEAYPEILYVDGRAAVPFEIEHGFNRVGDSYIDITFEYALGENPAEYEYLSVGEYHYKTIAEIAAETGYYGDYYRLIYARRYPGLMKKYKIKPITQEDVMGE